MTLDRATVEQMRLQAEAAIRGECLPPIADRFVALAEDWLRKDEALFVAEQFIAEMGFRYRYEEHTAALAPQPEEEKP